jgi:hypothetical protein
LSYHPLTKPKTLYSSLFIFICLVENFVKFTVLPKLLIDSYKPSSPSYQVLLIPAHPLTFFIAAIFSTKHLTVLTILKKTS